MSVTPVLFFFVISVLAQSIAQSVCNTNFKLMKDRNEVNIQDACKIKPCLTKCCAEKQILFKDGARLFCQSTAYLENMYNKTNLEDYQLDVYNISMSEIVKRKANVSDFTMLHYANFEACDYRQKVLGFMTPHVFENGKLALSIAGISSNRTIWTEIYSVGKFCFENLVGVNDSSIKIVFYHEVESPPFADVDKYRAFVTANCMVVSCVFLVLVFLVYLVLEKFRCLAGLLTMAYLAALTAFFLLRIIHVYANYYKLLDTKGCIVMTLLVYYALLSSFCWMNSLSFDIWWTFRATRPQLPDDFRGILRKFACYGLYGWGAPLLPLGFVVLADHVHIPGVVKPHVFEFGGCFFGEYSHKYYVRYVIAALVCADIVWYILTAYNIWRVRNAACQHSDDPTNKINESRFVLYVKLCLLMGIGRIFDALDEHHWVYYTIDALNAFAGLFIFLMFVCRKQMRQQLYARFKLGRNNGMQLHMRPSGQPTIERQKTKTDISGYDRPSSTQELVWWRTSTPKTELTNYIIPADRKPNVKMTEVYLTKG